MIILKNIFFSLLFFSISTLNASTDWIYKPFKPNIDSQKKIDADGGIVSACTGTDNSNWLVTKQSLWKWNAEQNQVEKIGLNLSFPDEKLVKVFCLENRVFVSSQFSFLEVKSENSTALRFSFDKDDFPILKVHGFKKSVVIFTQKSLVSLLDDSSIVTSRTNYSSDLRNLISKDKNIELICRNFSPESFYIFSKNILYSVNIINPSRILVAKLWQAPQKISNVFTNDQEIYLLNTYFIYRLSEEGKLLQTIPVSGDKHLVFANFKKEAHSFVFDDYTLQTFQLNTKKTDSSELLCSGCPTMKVLSYEGEKLLLLADKNILMYRVQNIADEVLK